MERRRLLVTGCGRSGTAYAALVWRALGLDVRHEMPTPPHGTMGADGAASWYMAVDDPHPPYGPSAADYAFDLVVHQVRHPLLVVPSVAQFVLNNPPSWRYIRRNAPQVRPRVRDRLRPRTDRLLLTAMRYWYHWNLLAARKAHDTVTLEQLPSALPRLCDRLGIPFDPAAVASVPSTVNERSHYVDGPRWTVTWPDLDRLDASLGPAIRHLAGSYGYDVRS